MYAANGVTSDIAVSSSGSVTFLRVQPTTTNASSPTSTPPPAATTKSRPTSRTVTEPTVAARAVRSATRAVASLSSDSPSRIVTIRRGQPDPAGDRGGGDRVGRRDHRTDRERQRPGDARDHPVHHDADARGGEQHQADRQQQDRPPVGVEVDQRRLQRGGVQQRRQQPEQHDLLPEVHLGDEREEAGADARGDQQQRGGYVDLAGDRGEAEHGDGEQDELERDLHGAQSPLPPPTRRPPSAERRSGCGLGHPAHRVAPAEVLDPVRPERQRDQASGGGRRRSARGRSCRRR